MASLRLKDTKIFIKLLETLKAMLEDGRIDEKVRKEYIESLEELFSKCKEENTK